MHSGKIAAWLTRALLHFSNTPSTQDIYWEISYEGHKQGCFWRVLLKTTKLQSTKRFRHLRVSTLQFSCYVTSSMAKAPSFLCLFQESPQLHFCRSVPQILLRPSFTEHHCRKVLHQGDLRRYIHCPPAPNMHSPANKSPELTGFLSEVWNNHAQAMSVQGGSGGSII